MRAKTAADAILYYEAGQTYVPTAALTDSGDHTTFNAAGSPWSGYSGKEPVVRPNGLLTGGVITPAVSLTNDYVDVAACTAYVAGVLVSVSADTDVAITRAVSTDTHIINSITITTGAIVVVAGTDGTSFSATRGAAGGPPLLGADVVEIGQVRTTSYTAAVIDEDEIFQVAGLHQERSDYPIWEEDWAEGTVTFAAVDPLIHTGPAARKTYAAYYTPIYSEIPNASDFVPAETTHTTSSTQVYGGVIGAHSSTLGQGSFSTRLTTGVIDGIISMKNKNLWFKFMPDRYRSEYILTQGYLGVARQFPAGDSIIANCTISADATSIDNAS